MFYGAQATIGQLMYNQAAVVLGNTVGGAVLMAGGLNAIAYWQTMVPARFRGRDASDSDCFDRDTKINV